MMKKNRLVCGVGINDANYVVRKETIILENGERKRLKTWICPYYRTWINMLKRCYSAKEQQRCPTYYGCSVSEDWLVFTNFKNWMELQNYQGKHLDKDILVRGNKVYSKDTCVFVDSKVNTFLLDCGATRGEYLIGACLHKPSGKFVSHCCNPFTKKMEYLGLFISEQGAHEAWLKRKLELAHMLASEQTDARVAKALISRYSNYNS